MIAPGRRSKCSIDELLDPRHRDLLGAERPDGDRDRVRDADRVRDVDLGAVGEPAGDDVLRHVARRVGRRAVDLRRILAREGAAAVPSRAAVGVDDDLAPGEPGVAHRPAEHELARRVHVDEVAVREQALLVVQVRRQDRPQNALDDVRLDQVLGADPVGVLRRDEDPLDLDRPLRAVLVDLVADGHLRLAVRAEVGQVAGLPHLGEPLADLVREHDRQRHQLGRLARRVAEHHPLVARAELVQRIVVARVVLHLVRGVDALGDVRRLLVDRDDDAAGDGVEAPLRVRVADLLELRARGPRDVDVRLRRDLAGDDDEPGRDQRLAGDPPVDVVAKDGVEHRVRDLVGDLVRVTLGDGLGCEEKLARSHGAEKASRSARRASLAASGPATRPRGRGTSAARDFR